jgi:hypothetical protein
MAVTKSVTMVSINEGGKSFAGDVLIGIVNLTVMDDAVEVINKDFSATYKKVDTLTVDQELARWANDIKSQMQDEINAYVNEQNLLTNAKLATAVSGIESALDTSGIGV